ncbi:MAG: hypothetical protein US52_C0018G0009 [candidate division WS6 bacterium GW2011_GWA2_37_6]|uniref:PPM-type phosphatase domain-containing protein n=1 Tax=candidate division WS6 bacterium GW2011_GWA2_37_6 TaxID=1619087 RepID=A0A0G0K4X8_9BACT|nr:MAG: hypothetical protein US52_C0018G0009 [candidate division WS6 bacterium GW2011_GWA2_37_6]
MNIQAYSQGKKPNRNEDSWKNNRNTIVVADGATDKSGKLYGGKTGGEIISKLLVDKCIENDLTGIDLVESLTQTVAELYKKTNPTALIDPHYLFSSTLVYVRVTGSKLLITQIGDTSFRINGKKAFHNSTLLDKLTSNARVDYIKSTNDVDGGRDFIMPILKEQTKYQNNPDHILGYGCIEEQKFPPNLSNNLSFLQVR